jgi:hypothetical protein
LFWRECQCQPISKISVRAFEMGLGEHILIRPQQRLLSQETVVDWYCFCLKSEEDPDPAKAEQFKRWREMRKLQEGHSQRP